MPAVRDGDRIVVVDAKAFRDDNTRMFVGVVEEVEEGLIRARGFSFHVSSYEVAGQERHSEDRVRLISPASGALIYLLPREVDITTLQLKRSPKSLMLTDNKKFSLDLSECLLRG